MKLELFAPIARTAQNTNPIFQNRFKQFPEYGETQRAAVYQRLERMDRELDGHELVAGGRYDRRARSQGARRSSAMRRRVTPTIRPPTTAPTGLLMPPRSALAKA